jgi:hypothetical protein
LLIFLVIIQVFSKPLKSKYFLPFCH